MTSKILVNQTLDGNSLSEVTGTTIEDKTYLDIIPGGYASSGNSTTTPLTNGTTFTGTGEQNFFPQVGVMLKTDQDAILYFDFSNDGTNWDSTFPVAGFQVAGGISEFHTAVKLGRYFRVRLVNDSGSDQTYLRLKTYYGEGLVPSVAPMNQSLARDHDATVVRPTIAEDEIVIGLRSGVRSFTKFGYNDNLTAAGGEEIIWDYASASTFTPMTSAETFTITYNNTTDGLGTTGALTLNIQYIDANGLPAASTHTLSNTGSDVTSFTGLGINRVSVSSSGSNDKNGNDIVLAATTATTVQAIVPANDSVTQQAIYHVSSNAYAVGKLVYVKVNKLSGGGTPRVLVKGYVYNRNVQTRYTVFREIFDTSGAGGAVSNIIEPVGFRLTPTDVLYFVADTDTNSTEVDIRFSVVEYDID